MTVCLCDKCKQQTKKVRYITFDVGTTESEYTFRGHNMRYVELCEDCFDELMNLWKGTNNAL